MKLNHKLILDLAKEEKQMIRDISRKYNCSMNLFCRLLLKRGIEMLNENSNEEERIKLQIIKLNLKRGKNQNKKMN